MIQTIVHTSENSNWYLYDDRFRLSILIHPELAKACDLLEGVDQYYVDKYEYLKKNGLFSDVDILANFKSMIDESMVESSIIRSPQIVFEVTDFCNLACAYCSLGDYYDSFDVRNSKKIDTKSAIKLLKYVLELKLKNNQNKLTISFYGGEPLLNIAFIKQVVQTVCEMNHEKKIDVAYNMTTNAVLIHKYIQFLITNNFDLLISLDGDEKGDSYRTFRVSKESSFYKVVKNMKYIQTNYPAYFNTNISFNAVLHNRNSVKEIYQYIYSEFHKIPQISELALDNLKSDEKLHFDKMFKNKRKSEAEFVKQDTDLVEMTHMSMSIFGECTYFLKYYSVNSFVSDVTSLLDEEEVRFPTNTCFPFSKKIFFTNRNKILPCEKINHMYSLGEVNEDVVINAAKIVDQFNFYYNHIQQVCQCCYTHRFCGMCLYSIGNLNNLENEKAICNAFHSKVSFQNKLCRIFSFFEKHPSDLVEIVQNVVITS